MNAFRSQASTSLANLRCTLCHQVFPKEEVYVNTQCGHKYCIRCMRSTQIPDEDYIECFHYGCGFHIVVNEMEDYFFQNDLKQILEQESQSIPPVDRPNIAQPTKNDMDLCKICHKRQRCFVAVPCGHYVFCESCSDLYLAECPLCDYKIERMVRVQK